MAIILAAQGEVHNIMMIAFENHGKGKKQLVQDSTPQILILLAVIIGNNSQTECFYQQ